MVNRSAPSARAIDDRGFAKYDLIPVVLGAFCLVAQACSWLMEGTPPTQLMLKQWVASCTVTFVLIRIVSFIWISVRTKRTPAARLDISTLAWELPAQAVAGAAVGLMIWSGLWLCLYYKKQEIFSLDDAAVFCVPWFLMAFLAGQVLLSGLTSYLFPLDRNREWWARASGWYGAAALGWVGIFGLVIFGLQELKGAQMLSLTAGSGVISLFGASPISGPLERAFRISQLSVTRVIRFASIVFIFCLSVLIATATTDLLREMSSWATGKYVSSLSWLDAQPDRGRRTKPGKSAKQPHSSAHHFTLGAL